MNSQKSTQTFSIKTPAKIAKYQIAEELGRGGMGIVQKNLWQIYKDF